MSEGKPTYEELLQRVENLEREKQERTLVESFQLPGEDVDIPQSEFSDSEIDLGSLINIREIQAILEDFYSLTNMLSAVVDVKGRVLLAVGWQNICLNFHRINPETARYCTESDLFLAENLKPGEYVSYKCKNGLWDVVTPLYVGEMHVGNVYTGQFFYEDEIIDEDSFLKQAEMYEFDREAYMQALRKIPRYSRESISKLMSFLIKFTTYISGIGYANINLEKEILERKKAESALKKSESLRQTLFNAIPDMVWLKDVQGIYNACNTQFEKVFDAKERDIIGKTDYDFVGEEIGNQFRKYDELVMKSGKPSINEEEITYAHDGHRELLETIKTPIYGPDGELAGVLGIGRDITERKKTEEEIYELNRNLELRVHQRTMKLAEANKELEDFVYSVSHDLRAPLRSISGFAEIIDRRHKESLNEEGQHYFSNIIKASGQMGELIDDLLRFSRLGGKAVKNVPVKLDDVFRGALETIADLVEETGAVINISSNMPVITGDATLATNLFINLFDNAIKYRKHEVIPRIDVSVEIDGSSFVISVKDNGIGIEHEYHEKVFKIFQRLHSQENYPGTGIGLAAVKKAVQIMNGEVWVESEPGEGSVFRVKLTGEKESMGEEND